MPTDQRFVTAPERMHAPDPPPYRINTWFFMCGPLAANIFLVGVACNLYLFKKYNMAIEKVFDMRRDEIPSARGVAIFALMLFGLQFGIFSLESWRRGDAFGHDDEVHMEILFLSYCVVVFLILVCPWDICHRACRFFLLRKLRKCLWPFQHAFSLQLPPSATPFIEVFVADGLTSLSKFLQDAAIAMLLFLMAMNSHQNDTIALRQAYQTKLKHSPLPYCAASLPYMIRAAQCLISFQRTTNENDRFLHLLNTLKYGSSLLVISVGAYPQVFWSSSSSSSTGPTDQSGFFLFCAVFNSLYSFLWDVIMDWGLGQPQLPKRVRFLRHQLLYKPTLVYYCIIVIDFCLRILWVTKWWDWRQYGVDFKLVSQFAEVVRRCMWNCVRVEWQCIKLEVLGSKKLSEDSMELEQNMENMPLMRVEENDDDDGEEVVNPAHEYVEKREKEDNESNQMEVELIAPASITVATFAGTTQVTTVVKDKDQSPIMRHTHTHHQRKSSSYYDEDEQLVPHESASNSSNSDDSTITVDVALS